MAEEIETPEGAENAPSEGQGQEQAGAEQGEPSQAEKSEGLSKDARMWGMLCHLAGIAGFLFPFGNVILPLIFWQLKKEELPFAGEQGKEALNFQISMSIYAAASVPLIFACGLGVLLVIAVSIVDLVLLIIASIKANNGESYRYPLTIRFIK